MTLKPKSIEVLEHSLRNPKASHADSYRSVHKSANDTTARTNAYKLFNKPEARIYLQKHIDKARTRIVKLVDSEKEAVALEASKDILDREFGRATQKQQIQSTRITISLGSLEQPELNAETDSSG